MRKRRLLTAEPSGETEGLARRVRRMALPLNQSADLDPLLERIGEAHYVLLGEASHGTSDYYQWRARISRRLIREKGFSFIAVEGDWPDCYRVNRYVKRLPDSGTDAREVLDDFDRWPTWMWANEEVVALAEWLRRHNAGRTEDRKVGFFGLDVYSLWESLYAVLGYLQQGRPIGAAGGPSRGPLLPALRRGRPGIRAGHDPGADVLRGRGRRLAQGAARQGAALPDRRPRGVLRRRAERPGRRRTPRPTTGPWCAAAPIRGTSATGT